MMSTLGGRSSTPVAAIVLALILLGSYHGNVHGRPIAENSGEATPTLTVPTVSYADLVDPAMFAASTSDEVLRNAMLEDGILSVSGIPGFSQLRRDVMLGAAKCGPHAPAARTTTFGDGTARRTFASVTKGFGVSDAIDFIGGDDKTSSPAIDAACSDEFKAKVDAFRAVVSSVTEQFTKRLSESFPTKEGKPLLWNMPHTESFATVEDVARAAEHLEHFHAYHRPASAGSSAAAEDTIDLHADQGLFIAFTPGLIVEYNENDGDDVKAITSADGATAPAGTFYVERRDGTHARCEFGFDGDVLVLMLGDLVDTVVNPKMPEGVELRSAPHGMTMPAGLMQNQARMWYGRMFLPPGDALSEKHGITYAQLRAKVIEQVHSGGGVGSGVGCSRRELQETDSTQCADNQMYCWMRCMNYTAEASPSVCAGNSTGAWAHSSCSVRASAMKSGVRASTVTATTTQRAPTPPPTSQKTRRCRQTTPPTRRRARENSRLSSTRRAIPTATSLSRASSTCNGVVPLITRRSRLAWRTTESPVTSP